MDRVLRREAERVALARRLAQRSAGEPAIDRLTELAARLLDAPSAQVSLVAEQQTVLGGTGEAAPEVGRSSPAADSLCSLTVDQATTLAIADASCDPRVAHLPPVASGATVAYLGVPLRAADGHVVGALCVYDTEPRVWSDSDVTTLERLGEAVVAELELAALSIDFQAGQVVWELAADAARIGTFDWDILEDVLEFDERLLELFGLERKQFGGSIAAFEAAVHPDDLPRVNRAIEHAINTCGEYAAEYRVMLPSGGVRWVAARGRALAGPDGSTVRLTGAAYDTTAQQDADTRVSRVLEAIPTAFVHLDRDWRFRYVNAQAERLLGAGRTELYGRVLWDVFPDAIGSDFERRYRDAMDSGVAGHFDAYYPPPLDTWFEVRAWPTPDGLSVYFNDVTVRHQAQRTLERAARQGAVLARASERLTGSLDADEVLARLADLVVPALGDWCLGTLLDDAASEDFRHAMRDVAWSHRDPELLPMVERFAEVRIAQMSDLSFMPTVLASNAPLSVHGDALAALEQVTGPGESRDLLHRLAPESATVVRLPGRSGNVGLLTVFRGADREPFSDEDLDLLRELASRAGLALDNARLFAEQRDLAEALQRSMLSDPPAHCGLEIAVRYEPAAQAAQVGGDWYDAFLQPNGAMVLVVGDVVGHDVAAAAAMGQVRALLRAVAVHSDDGPAGVLTGVDRVMQTLEVDSTATAIVVRLEQTAEERDAGTTRVRWSSAGHPPAFLIDPDGAVQRLGGLEPDLLLGFDAALPRNEQQVTVRRGSTLLLYTDGLVERRGEPIDVGVERLAALLHKAVPGVDRLEELCDELVGSLTAEGREDDVALVAVRLHPQDRPHPS